MVLLMQNWRSSCRLLYAHCFGSMVPLPSQSHRHVTKTTGKKLSAQYESCLMDAKAVSTEWTDEEDEDGENDEQDC